ncbi:MAG: M20 family metallopeptidase [Promethearchaeota archaeon]
MKTIPSQAPNLLSRKEKTPFPRPSPDDIFHHIETKRARLIAVLGDLIRIPTVVPPGSNYEEIVTYLETQLQKLKFQTKRVIVPTEEIAKIPLPLEGPRINLVARQTHQRQEVVTIYAHMDVVPTEEPWTKDPFNPVVEDGKLFGRGAIDMKGSIAVILLAMEVIHELKLRPHFNLVCTFCTDEEIGMYPGIFHLAKEGYVQGHVINTELGGQVPVIVAGVAGNVDVTLTVKGRSCHSGMNFMGINAIEATIPILTELLKLKNEVEKRESAIPLIPLLRSLGAPSDKVTPMFNIDIIQGGTKSNIVPAECQVVINRRYIPEETYEQVVEEIKQAITRGKTNSKAVSVETAIIHTYRPFKADTTSQHALKMREALKAVHNYQDSDFIFGGGAASTDMGFITQGCGIDKIIGIGAASLDNLSAHKPDEWVRIDDLINMAKQLVHYLCL